MAMRIWVLLSTMFVSGALVDAQSGLTLADLEQRALRLNPTLVQADAQLTAAEHRAAQAGRWPNPSIGYTAEEVSNSPTIRGGEHGLFIEQVFPMSGKLGADRDVFLQEVEGADAARDMQRMRVINAVRGLYHDALVAARRVELRGSLSSLTDEAVMVSRRLANVGAADQTDLLASEIEAEQTLLSLEEARQEETRVWQTLAQVVGDPTLRAQPLAGDADAPLPRLDHDRLLEMLLRDSPELRAAQVGAERARAMVARERREPHPDLVVRLGPRYNRELLDPGPRPVGWEFFADVGVTVPLWNRNRDGAAAAEADLGRATAEVTRVELELRSRLAEAFQRYATGMRRVQTYRDEILPRAAEAHRLFLSRYQEMAAAYPQVLVAQRTLFQIMEEYLAALATSWRAAVLLEGSLLDGALDPPRDPAALASPAG